MMTIKFRGKCTKDSKYAGEWVTGGVVICEKTNDVLIISAITDNVKCTFHVIPETLGQFTNQIDKNGNEVFVGDIATDGKYLYTVEFSEESCSFVWHRHGSYNNFHFERQNDAEEMEIVGNIHDNPELLSK